MKLAQLNDADAQRITNIVNSMRFIGYPLIQDAEATAFSAIAVQYSKDKFNEEIHDDGYYRQVARHALMRESAAERKEWEAIDFNKELTKLGVYLNDELEEKEEHELLADGLVAIASSISSQMREFVLLRLQGLRLIDIKEELKISHQAVMTKNKKFKEKVAKFLSAGAHNYDVGKKRYLSAQEQSGMKRIRRFIDYLEKLDGILFVSDDLDQRGREDA